MITGIINEEWRSISGYVSYQVSNIGRVRNSTTGRILKAQITSGYYRVALTKHNVKRLYLVHRLVAQEFIDNPADKPSVDHINHSKTDNTVNNLRWVSVSENGMNMEKRQNLTSKYKGVSFCNTKHRWRASIMLNGSKKHLGYLRTEKEAAAKYNNAASELFGDYALLNEISSDESDNETEDVDDDETHTDSEV